MLDRGIIMCNYKKVREELGTIKYEPEEKVKIPDLNLNYDELYKTRKESKKKKKSLKNSKKTIVVKENEK